MIELGSLWLSEESKTIVIVTTADSREVRYRIPRDERHIIHEQSISFFLSYFRRITYD